MTSRFLTAALSTTILLVAAACGFAQDKKPKAEAAPAADKPGKEHAHLRRLAGRWNCEVKLFENPSKPVVTKATAFFRVLLGGRYVQQQFNGTMLGGPFQGVGTTGYDNAKKKYVSTGIMTTEGTYDVKTQTLAETGTTSTPMGPGKLRMISKYLSDDKFVFTMYMPAGKGEHKLMEITYTRAPKTSVKKFPVRKKKLPGRKTDRKQD
jgi:hypothetical protein